MRQKEELEKSHQEKDSICPCWFQEGRTVRQECRWALETTCKEMGTLALEPLGPEFCQQTQ